MSLPNIAQALDRLDREIGAFQTTVQVDPMDPRRRVYTVPVGNRRQVVSAGPTDDPMFGQRLDFVSLASTKLPEHADVLFRILWIARGLRRARVAVIDRGVQSLTVLASFVPDELTEVYCPRHLAALFEVAAVADSLEAQLHEGGDQF